FTENIRGEEFARLLHVWSSTVASEPLPTLITGILASYFHVLSRYVVLPHYGSALRQPISLKSFFTPNSELGVMEFSKPWASHKLFNQCLPDRLRERENFEDKNLATIADAMRQMDSETESRGILPSDFEKAKRELKDFSTRFGCDVLISQAHLISEKTVDLKKIEKSLEQVKMPEKRHLSWLQQKKLGARRNTAEWILRKIV
ncbi:MAG: hypothetical protein HC845_06285, partial [Akkermansiaceae bacterium]|nr:hypothetical protein [Akkermansiaceae bacterium]